MLLICITVAFLGWIAWLLNSLVDENKHRKNSSLLDVHHDGALQNHHLLAVRPSRIYAGGYWVNLAFLFVVILTVALLFCKYKTVLFCRICIWIESDQRHRDATQFAWFTSNCIFFFVLWMHVCLSLVLYGCETWSLILRNDHRLGCAAPQTNCAATRCGMVFRGTAFYNSFFDFLGIL